MLNENEAGRCDSPDAFREWLQEHQDSVTALWVIIAKKNSRTRLVTYQEALDVALQHGWIDGLARRVDEDTCNDSRRDAGVAHGRRLTAAGPKR